MTSKNYTMANMKLDKDSNDELQSWLSRTAWDRNTVVSYMIADFNSSLRHLKAVDDRLFEQGKTESERVMELLSEIQHKQISGFTLIFYLQKYMPRGEFLLKQEEGEV